MSLKTKITLVVMLLLICCSALLTYVVERQLTENMQELLARQQFSTATYVASDLDGKIRLRLELLEAAAERLTPALLADPDQARDFLISHVSLLKLFKRGLTLISKDGMGIADYPSAQGRAGASFTSQEYFQEISATGRAAIGRPLVGRFTQEPGVVFGVPVKDAAGGFIGVLAGYATFADQTLFGQAQNTRLGKTGYIAIDVPKYGLIATCSDPARIMQPMAEPGQNAMLDKFVAGYEGSGITVNSKEVEVLTSGKQIPSAGWIAQLVLPVEEAFAPIRELRMRVYAVGASLSLLAIGVLWLVIGKLLAPLARASGSVREMSSGIREFQALPVTHLDEVGRLLTNFNLLVEDRKRFESALGEAQGLLETKVQERTSELSRAMVDLTRARDQADSSSRMKTEFLANVSHELRTPLIPILGMTELLLDTPLNPVQRDYLLETQKAAARLDTIITDLIELTGLDVSKPNPGPLSLKTIMDIIERELSPAARARGLEFQVGLGAAVPALVLVDMALLRLVLVKLVANAIKFTPAGRVSVFADLAGREETRAVIRFLVSDTGVGIPRNKLEEIISGLTQAENPMVKRFGGLGLGLAAVRKAVSVLGGRVDVQSEPGQGSTFQVVLSLVDCTEEQIAACLDN